MDLVTGDDGLPVVSAEDLSRASLADIDDWRRHTPVLRSNPMRVVALRAEDVIRLISDPRLVQLPGAQYALVSGIPEGQVRNLLEGTMLMTNGPAHQHLRGAFNTTFAHPVVRRKREQVRAVADRIVADLPRDEPFDFLDLCASRLPAEVIATVLGLPVDQSAWFARQVYSLSRCLSVPYEIGAHDDIEAAAEALYHFTAESLDARRAAPRDDLLSMLVTDRSERALQPDELIHQVMTIILAGSDTTRAAFNMLVGRLLEQPARWDEVRADRTLIPAAIDESLRLDPPVGSLPRYVTAPVEFGTLTVPPGQVLGLSTLSAMRDENSHESPERFDLHRGHQLRPHPVFGGGAHRCLGEMLARIELEEGLAALMDGVPRIALVEPGGMVGFGGIRRATPLVVRIA